MCGQNDVPLRMCFRILSNGFQKSRSAVQQSNCKLAAQQTTFNNQCIIEQRTKTTFNNQGVGGRRRPGEAAPRALLGGDMRRGPRGAAHSTRARQGPALAGQARAPQGRGRRGFGGGASGCRRCSSVRAGSRWGGGTEATGGERASRAQQGGGQRRRSDARGREADSGKPRGGWRPRAQGA